MCAMKLMRVDDDDGTIKNSDDAIYVQSIHTHTTARAGAFMCVCVCIEVIDEFNSAYDRDELKRKLLDVIHRVTYNRH